MPTKMFVNLPVEDLERSEEFFAALGFDFFAVTEGMASVIISEHTQVMLLTTPVFAGYASRPVADATESTEVILVLGVEERASVDRLVDAAVAGGGSPAGTPQDSDGRYQRGFFDLDGHHWEALSLQ
jgi:predicted lactoylglutathione lyase